MSATLNKTEGEVTQLGLSRLSTSPSSTFELSEHTGNTMTVGEWPRADPENSTFTSLPYTEPKQGFLCLKFLGSKRKQIMVISAVIIILTASVAVLPPILFIYFAVWPWSKCIHYKMQDFGCILCTCQRDKIVYIYRFHWLWRMFRHWKKTAVRYSTNQTMTQIIALPYHGMHILATAQPIAMYQSTLVVCAGNSSWHGRNVRLED